jgi:hypothetical protein
MVKTTSLVAAVARVVWFASRRRRYMHHRIGSYYIYARYGKPKRRGADTSTSHRHADMHTHTPCRSTRQLLRVTGTVEVDRAVDSLTIGL